MPALDLDFDLGLFDIVDVRHHPQTLHIPSKVKRLRISLLDFLLVIQRQLLLLLRRPFEYHLTQELTCLLNILVHNCLDELFSQLRLTLLHWLTLLLQLEVSVLVFQLEV